MIVTPSTHKPVIQQENPLVKKQSILSPIEGKVYAQKQELVKVPVQAPKAPQTGSCASWMAQAGISNADAVWLIQKESGCNPTAQNPTSTAYGIFQFLNATWAGQGCVKTSDPVQQMICGQRYVMNRYGSWANAKSHHLRHNWF